MTQEVHGGIMERVRAILTADEVIEAIAVQMGIAGLRPDAVVLTNKRFILYHPGLLSVKFEDYLWRDLADVRLSEGLLGSTLSFKARGAKVQVDKLDRNQARPVYVIAQQREQEAAEIRRQRQMQEDSAKAGHIIVGQTPAAPGVGAAVTMDDPMAKLTKLKNLLDAGLITQEEHDKKKGEILAAL